MTIKENRVEELPEMGKQYSPYRNLEELNKEIRNARNSIARCDPNELSEPRPIAVHALVHCYKTLESVMELGPPWLKDESILSWMESNKAITLWLAGKAYNDGLTMQLNALATLYDSFEEIEEELTP